MQFLLLGDPIRNFILNMSAVAMQADLSVKLVPIHVMLYPHSFYGRNVCSQAGGSVCVCSNVCVCVCLVFFLLGFFPFFLSSHPFSFSSLFVFPSFPTFGSMFKIFRLYNNAFSRYSLSIENGS